MRRPGPHGSPGAPGVALGEVGGLAFAAICARAGRTEALSRGLEQRLGIALPTRPARTAHGANAVIWSGPGQWLGIGLRQGDFLPLLADIAGDLASITDLTGSRVVIRVACAGARRPHEGPADIDLHPRTFKPGDAAHIVASHMPTQLWQTDAEPTYEIACTLSYALSLWRNLSAAVAEYGYRVETFG